MAVHSAPSPRRLLAFLLVAAIAAAACKPGGGEATPTSAATMAAPVRVTPSQAATTVAR